MRIIAIVFMLLTIGCTLIQRDYKVTIYVCENSTVYFTPEILADIDKEAESKTDATVDATIDIPVIP